MPRILLIEDDHQVRAMLKMRLERAGYEIVEATDGVAGTQMFRTTPVDLVITDILMPEKDGLETIMDFWRDAPDVKIIAISGGSRSLDPETCLDCARAFGAVKTFQKPVDFDALLAAIGELLETTNA